MTRRVLITGASGFCARHLAARLRDSGPVHLCGTDLAEVAPVGSHFDEYHQADLTDGRQVANLVRRVEPDWVFHLAGLFAEADAAEIYRVNVLGTINLLESYRRFTPADACMLLVGSAAEYGLVDSSFMPVEETMVCKPTSTYGISKYAATMAGLDFAQRYGRKIVVARPFNIIGAGVPPTLVLGAVLQRIKEAFVACDSPVIRIGNTSSKRDFIAVEDVVNAYVRLMEAAHWGEVFNICSGEARSIQSLLDQVVTNSSRAIVFQHDTELVRPSDLSSFFGNNEKARLAFGFAPKVSIEAALASAWWHVMERNSACVL